MIEIIAGAVFLVATTWLGSYANKLAQTARGGRTYRFQTVSCDTKPALVMRSTSVHQNLR